ncbi:DUF1648 domain-containing protein [Nonlabens tegetincola]
MATQSVPTAPAAGVSGRRPAREFQTGPVTVWLRRAAIAVTVVGWVGLLASYRGLPEVVPVHFNMSGTTDGWGPKSVLLVLGGVFSMVVVAMVWLSRAPQVFSYPFEVTPDNAQTVYREGERMLVWVTLSVATPFPLFVLSSTSALNMGVPVMLCLVAMLAATGVGVSRLIVAAR